MLRQLNPPYAQIGMVAFPPLESTASDVCGQPYNSISNGYNGYDSATRGYVTDVISGDYRTAGGALNQTSGLYLHTVPGPSSACIQAGGNTSYSEALRQAQANSTRTAAKVPNYIVFLTDGKANIGSV